jgi:hypothetical protein
MTNLYDKLIEAIAEAERTAEILAIVDGDEDFKLFAAYLQLGTTAMVKGDIYEMLKALMPLVESKLAVAKNQNAMSSVAIDPRFSGSDN